MVKLRFLKLGLLVISIMIVSRNVEAQILHPVHWSFAAKKTGKRTAVIFIKATFDGDWHIYSVNQKDGGPLKTSFQFSSSKNYRLIDKVVEPKPITRYEKVFNMDVYYFEKIVIFQQKVALTSSDAVVSGKVSFMTCNDERCLPPDEVSFRIPIK